MANNSPTIVAASLSDDQLKKSIDSLVSYVDKAMGKMVQSTNNAVGEMEAKLKSLGNVRIDSGGSADGGSSRRTSAVEKETKARKELNMTLDQQAAALEKASGKRKGIEYTTIPSDIDKSLTYLVNTNKDVEAQMSAIIQKEQALIDAKQREAQITEQIASAQRAANSIHGVSAYDLGINPNVSVGRQRQIESTRTASKETEYLKQQVASLLEVEEREVKSVNMATASYSELSQYLKQLQSAYNRLGADRIKKGEGVDIAKEIQRTQRAMQKFQQTMSRPVSLKDALGGSEKTLDDLAYKMRRLQSYRSGLNFKTQSDEVLRVNQKYAELQKKMDVIMERNQRMVASNNALGRSWNYMKNRLAFYITVGAGTSFIKQLIDIRSQYEMNEKALGILLDSASRGTRIFNELSQMALVSPYTLIELSNAAKQLTAYDIAAKDVVDTTRRLADMASAVGVPVERLTYALGQIKAYGYLNSRDARMFANAGIPLVKQLADRYSELEGKMVSTADVYDRMKKKAIDYNDVMAVINKMTDEGGKFFDFQAKMAETLKVRLANLTLAWNNMLNDMGKDNQGWFSSGLKGLTTVFKHWRELYRIISTIIVALGAYKAASMVAGVAASRAVSSTIPAWFRLASIVRTTQGNMALLGLTMRSIPFTAWVTAIATLASYFILFNNSSDDVKQKLEDIKSAFDGVRKEVETLFADAIKTDSIGAQLTKLRDMLELAETELGVTIPIRLEDVNESNIKQKLKEAKQFVDEYINFSQTFSESAAGTKFNELMNDFGSKARSTYTNVTESINSVVVALQELSDKGKASKRDIEILNELTSGQKEDESRIEYLQRLISLYEELGLIGQKKVEPMIEHNFFMAYFSSTWDNMEELEQEQEKNLDRLGIKNKSVFENMLKDVQEYYSSSSIAAYQLELQVMRVAEKIDINNIPVEQRTMKLTAAINEEASQNNWNQFEKEFARQIANKKFGTTIEISDESKKAAEEELQDWQRNIKEWAKNNSITFDVSFQTNDTEASYAKRMLQEAKDAKELWETLSRKEKQGTGSKDATTQAYNDYIERRKLAEAAGADLSSLDPKNRNKAESELAKALKDELSTIDKIRSIYKDLTKEGMSHANAVERATRGWDETVNAINRVLQKNGLQKLDLSKFAGVENPRELVNMLQSQLNILVGRGAKPADIKELQTKIQTLNVDAEKYDLTRITKGLNSELDKLKDEYELSVELDANPELGGMFLDIFGIDTTDFPKTIDEYMSRAQQEFDKMRKKRNFSAPLNIFKAGDKEWEDWGRQVGLVVDVLDENGNVIDKNTDALDKITPKFKEAQGVAKKWATDVVNNTKKLEYELAELNDKIAIKEKEQAQLHERIEKEKNEATKHYLELTYQSNEKAIDELRAQALSLMPEYARVFNSIAEYSAGVSRRLQRDLMRVFDEAKYDSANKKWTLTGSDGKQTILNDTQYRKEREKLTREMRKSQAPFKKIKEAFKPSDKNGVVDYAKGIELVSAEVQKLGSVASEVGNLAQIFGADEQTVEIINDVATSLNGVATAGQGISQIASGDYIGGAASVLSGITSIIGAWSDNSNKKIDAKIKDSERAVKRLENAYKNLEFAIENAYGTNVIGAKEAAIENKKLQLAELQRQLELEKSRDSKNRDQDKIEELKGQIIDLQNEITKASQDIVNDLLGISSVADAAMQFADTYIEALRKGEDANKAFQGSFKELIANMIKQILVAEVIGPELEKIVEGMRERIANRSQKEAKAYKSAVGETTRLSTMSDDEIRREIAQNSYQDEIERLKKERDEKKRQLDKYDETHQWYNAGYNDSYKYAYQAAEMAYQEALAGIGLVTQQEIDEYKKDAAKREKEAKEALDKATKPTIDDMNYLAEGGKKLEGELGAWEDWYNSLLDSFGLKEDAKNLSALQQGIQGITEDTAGALEAYMNGVSQQVYAHTTLLTQIRDAIVGMNTDIQLGVFSQMLLQLQSSYQVQMSIQGILEGVLNPSGRAFTVELLS